MAAHTTQYPNIDRTNRIQTNVCAKGRRECSKERSEERQISVRVGGEHWSRPWPGDEPRRPNRAVVSHYSECPLSTPFALSDPEKNDDCLPWKGDSNLVDRRVLPDFDTLIVFAVLFFIFSFCGQIVVCCIRTVDLLYYCVSAEFVYISFLNCHNEAKT